MKRISASNTRLYQIFRPFLFWYFGLMFVAMGLRHRLEAMGIQFPSVIAVAMLLALVIAWFTRYAMRIADEVTDLGDVLLVKQSGRLERVEIRNITEVQDRTPISWPPKVVLLLHTPSSLGSKIVFCPQGGGARFSGGNPVANDLRARVQQCAASAPVS